MKKMISGLLLLAGIGFTATAQEPIAVPVSNTTTVYGTTTDSSTYVAPVTNTSVTNNTATTSFTVPLYADRAFRTSYPMATRSTWYRVNDDWYRVTYVDNGPWYTVGYYAHTPRGESYPIALPVRNNAVPDNVVNAVLDRYTGVYDITETIGSDHQTQYIVRTIGADGVVVTNRVNANAETVPM